MDASTILAATVGAVDGTRTAVDIQVSQDLMLANSSNITTFTSGSGRGGDVQLTAGTLTMESFTSIVTATVDGGGVGGNVVLNVGTVSLTDAASIQSQTQNLTPVSGQGGNVIIQGLPGAEFGAAESVTLSGGSSLLTQTFGSSNGGGVAIMSKSLTMNGPATTINASANDVGLGGDIVLSIQQASLSGGATMVAQSLSADLHALAAGSVTVQGLPGAESMANSVVLSGLGSGIFSDSFGLGRPGDVAVQAKTVSLTDGAAIQAGSPQNSGAAGGNVTIEADSVDISSGSHISSQATHSDSGQVTITANTFTSDNGSITTQSVSEGRGGDIVLNVGSASLSNGATINSNSVGSGNAGNITINSDSNILMQDSSVTTAASQASGGQVTFTAPDMIHLVNSSIITSVAGSNADTAGGNITIDPQFVVLQNSQILAKAFAGTGGAIDITATSAFIADPVSIVDASSTLGISGTVNIQSPLQNVGGELTALPQEFSSAAALLAQQCAARAAGGTFSTFVVAAREGLPVEPGGFLASPPLTSELLGSRISGQDRQTQPSAVTGLFPRYEARPIQLAKFGGTCR
jgi:large exoprotein involved in heme utilization and adhesion